MPTLRSRDLCKSFGGSHALINVCFELPASGIIAIIGPNGAGKTTLLNILTGFLSPSAGHCWWGEQEITYLSPYQIVKFGVARTFQDLRLIQQVSVIENVLLAYPKQNGEHFLSAILRSGYTKQEAHNHQEALRLLGFIGLEKMASTLAGELSYGQQKLLSLACCLATKAQVLLLDEPVAGVHPKMISYILTLLQQLREEGKLIIFIEHDINVVRQVADIVIVMDAGKIIAQGSPQEILERPEIMEVYLA
jgi:ABC-type branched-subunit amino acid transport system ATPase component